MSKAAHRVREIPRSEPEPVNPDLYPRLHQPNSLRVGESVFYRGLRYYIERAPAKWEEGTHIRIADCIIRPDQPAPLSRTSFNVHADLLEIAPTSRNKFGRQPTKKAVERRERQKVDGVRDNGDDVAVLLRDCSTLDDVYAAAAKYLGVPEPELRAKYGHLNPGQQRMNCGNRMRGEAKRRAK
jgi:hypothetical protein